MVIIYPIGVPVFYALMMYSNRRQLKVLQRMEIATEAQTTAESSPGPVGRHPGTHSKLLTLRLVEIILHHWQAV